MAECIWSIPNSLSIYDVLLGVVILVGIVLFSILAGRAEAQMWRAINRFNGERRALQRQITLGKSHLR
jgi:hypothetical protein